VSVFRNAAFWNEKASQPQSPSSPFLLLLLINFAVSGDREEQRRWVWGQRPLIKMMIMILFL